MAVAMNRLVREFLEHAKEKKNYHLTRRYVPDDRRDVCRDLPCARSGGVHTISVSANSNIAD
jgi:hypothetical protein